MSAQRANTPGMRAALRALEQRRGEPADEDRPPPSTFPGPKVNPLPGQLDLYGGEVPPNEPASECSDP
jgi:hypothetical protein